MGRGAKRRNRLGGGGPFAASLSGAAYVYRWDGIQWVEQAKLTASNGATLDKFGQSVAFSGRTALVGAYVDDIFGGDFTGSAYIFGWEP